MSDITLTPKQAQVFSLLSEGQKVSAIAKKMKITPSGVYGHIRKMREIGVVMPGEAIDTNGARPVKGDSHIARALEGEYKYETIEIPGRTPEEAIKAAIAESQNKILEVGNVIALHRQAITDTEEAIKQAEAESARLADYIQKLDKAQEALA